MTVDPSAIEFVTAEAVIRTYLSYGAGATKDEDWCIRVFAWRILRKGYAQAIWKAGIKPCVCGGQSHRDRRDLVVRKLRRYLELLLSFLDIYLQYR